MGNPLMDRLMKIRFILCMCSCWFGEGQLSLLSMLSYSRAKCKTYYSNIVLHSYCCPKYKIF